MSGADHRIRRIASFMTLAREELRAAAKLRDDNERQAAYFQQQAVEKAARAVLEAEDVRVGPTHNIFELAKLLPAGHPLYGEIAQFDELSSAATRYRYPGGAGRLADPAPGQVEHFQTAIVRLIEKVETYLRGKGFGS